MSFTAFWDLLKTTAIEWWNDNTFRLAASLAFYTVFSLGPIIMIAVAVASTVFGTEAATRELVTEIERLVGQDGGRAVREVADSVQRLEGGPLAVLLGLVTLVISSTVVFAELQSALNHIWDVEADPQKRGVILGLIMDRLLSFALVLAIGFLLLVSLAISALMAGMQNYMTAWLALPWLWQGLNVVLSFVIVTVLFMLIYKFLPDVKITWRDVIIGAVVTALLFTLGKFLIGFYLGQMAVGTAYGAAGSFAVLLIWMYYSALVSFFGAEFTQVFARRFGSHIRPKDYALRKGNKSDAI